MINKANLRDLIAATGLVILLKLNKNHLIFQPVWPRNWMDNLEKQFKTAESQIELHPEKPNSGKKWQPFVLCDL